MPPITCVDFSMSCHVTLNHLIIELRLLTDVMCNWSLYVIAVCTGDASRYTAVRCVWLLCVQVMSAGYTAVRCVWLLRVQVMPAGIQQSGVCDCCVYRWCQQVYSSQVLMALWCLTSLHRWTNCSSTRLRYIPLCVSGFCYSVYCKFNICMYASLF